jgi:hypothetical protein
MTIRRMRAAGPLQTAGRGRRSNRRRTRLGLPRALTGPPDKGIRPDLFVPSPPPRRLDISPNTLSGGREDPLERLEQDGPPRGPNQMPGGPI